MCTHRSRKWPSIVIGEASCSETRHKLKQMFDSGSVNRTAKWRKPSHFLCSWLDYHQEMGTSLRTSSSFSPPKDRNHSQPGSRRELTTSLQVSFLTTPTILWNPLIWRILETIRRCIFCSWSSTIYRSVLRIRRDRGIALLSRSHYALPQSLDHPHAFSNMSRISNLPNFLQ